MVVQMGCDATRTRSGEGEGERRGEEGEKKKKRREKTESALLGWGDRSGDSRLIPQIISPDSVRFPGSPFPGNLVPTPLCHTWHRSRSIPRPPSPLPSSPLSRPPFPPVPVPTVLCLAMLLPPPFQYLTPPQFASSPTLICVRLFPHVVLIIYTFFHFSALFFSALPIKQARFSSHPLIHLYARRYTPAFPRMLHLSFMFIPSELDSAKTSLSARSAGSS